MKTADLPVHFVESLQHMAGVKIATTLLRLPKIKMEINRSFVNSLYHTPSTKNVQNAIQACVSELPIPKLLQTAVSDVIGLVFHEIMDFIRYNDFHVFGSTTVPRMFEFLDEIVFKSEGLIDYLATVRSVLKTNKLNEEEKFQIISSYCLEDLMNTISSDLLQPNVRESLLDQNKLLQYYWSCTISGNLNEIDKIVPRYGLYSANTVLMKYSRTCYLAIAVEHFWKKLSTKEKYHSVPSIAGRFGMRASYVMSFVNEMGLQEKLGSITYCWSDFLKTVLLDLYWTKYFSQISRRFSDMLSCRKLEDICKSLCTREMELLNSHRCTCIRFIPTFIEFWNTIPVANRTAVFKRAKFGIQIVLLHLHDEVMDEIVKWFADMDYETVKNFLFSLKVMWMWCKNIAINVDSKDELLEKLYIFLLRMLSKDDALELFQNVKRFSRRPLCTYK